MASRVWHWPVFRLLATDRCRVAAPWFVWSRSPDDLSALRRLAVELERRRLSHVTRLENVVAAVAFFPFSLVSIFVALRRWGGALSARYDVPRHRQFVQLCAYAWRIALPPRDYYYLRLHRHPWRRSGRHFIPQPELHHLQRHISPADLGALENKLRFAARAAAEGLPHVPIFSVWRGSAVLDVNGAPVDRRLPRQNIFVKRSESYASSGVMGFRYDAASDLYSDENRSWSEPELRQYLWRGSATHTLLVQPWLENHPDLRGFSDSALCNFRVVTAYRRDQATAVLMAAFRFPWRSRVSSSEQGITLSASVDLATGTLRAAEAKEPAIGRLTVHPVTGQRIEGFVVPRWSELLETARRCHDVWPEFPFIGWDLALTDCGIFVLEGGPLWGAALAQMAGSGPLGLTAFPQLYLAQLARQNSPSHEHSRSSALSTPSQVQLDSPFLQGTGSHAR